MHSGDKIILANCDMGPIPVPIVIASDQIMWAWTVAYIINKANLKDLIAANGLVILFKFNPNHRFVSPCDLEI